MPLDLFNDQLDDTPASAGSDGFAGVDTEGKPNQLPPEILRGGGNIWMDANGLAQTRPGLRYNSLLNAGEIGAGSIRVQGLAYYDTPVVERLLAVRNGKLYEIDSADFDSLAIHLPGPAPSATATVKFAQLIDRMFYSDGVLRWSLYTSAWSHGGVTAFSNTAPMPVWATLISHNFRLLAVESKGHKLYASAIGQAHAAADWAQTDNIRVGTGEGDPIKALVSGQGGNLIVLNLGSAWLVDTTEPLLANWTVRKLTDVAGCVEGKTAVAIGQDVFFLSRYGVVSLGALSNTDSINPATTLSAPMQGYIDRINWLEIGSAFATVWQDLYLLALPLDGDSQPGVILAFNVRTRRWMSPWSPGVQGVLVGEIGGAAVLIDEADCFLVDEAGAVLLDSGEATPDLTALEFDGLCAAAVSRFDGRQETHLADSIGRIYRIDPTYEKDDTNPTSSQDIASWALLKAYDFGLPQHYKQPFLLELLFERSTASAVQVNFLRDGRLGFPDVPLAECEVVAAALTTGNLTSFPIVFPVVFTPNAVYQAMFHLRALPRFREAGFLIHATRGRLRLRSARFAAFIDTPDLIR
jgi:hypothetical protein